MTYRVGLAALLLATACKDKPSASPPPPPPPQTQPVEPVVHVHVPDARLVNVSGAEIIVQGAERADAAVVDLTVPEGMDAAVLGPDGARLGAVARGTLAAVVPGAGGPALIAVEPVPPPPAGKGVVVLRGDALRGTAFTVGDGGGKCLHQRLQDDGYAAATLGGAYPVVVDLAPGAQTIALHRWPGRACTTEVAHRFTVDVVAGATTVVFVRRADDGAVSEITIAR